VNQGALLRALLWEAPVRSFYIYFRDTYAGDAGVVDATDLLTDAAQHRTGT